MTATAWEISANSGGAVGTEIRFVTLSPSRDRVRLLPSATRSITVHNLGPATVRHATVSNSGALGSWSDVASGSSFTVASADGQREALLTSSGQADASAVLRCVIAAV
jgi:hypothetical protein